MLGQCIPQRRCGRHNRGECPDLDAATGRDEAAGLDFDPVGRLVGVDSGEEPVRELGNDNPHHGHPDAHAGQEGRRALNRTAPLWF